jgi:uncharacterized protein (UPF0147 family)
MVELTLPITTDKTAPENIRSQAYATTNTLNASTATKKVTTAETRDAQHRISSAPAQATKPGLTKAKVRL